MTYEIAKLLDRTGWNLLRLLQGNARVTFAELSRLVNLSVPAVAERIRKMEEAGIITGYHADIDLSKVGMPITAFVRVRTSGERSVAKIHDLVEAMQEVFECHHLTGEDYFILKVAVSSISHLEETLERLQPYGQTTASVVLSTLLTRRIVGEEAVTLEGEQDLPLKARISRYRP